MAQSFTKGVIYASRVVAAIDLIDQDSQITGLALYTPTVSGLYRFTVTYDYKSGPSVGGYTADIIYTSATSNGRAFASIGAGGAIVNLAAGVPVLLNGIPGVGSPSCGFNDSLEYDADVVATAGSFDITIDGDTATIPWDVTYDAFLAALEGLPSVGAGNVYLKVFGIRPFADGQGFFLLTFTGDLAQTAVTVVVDDAALTGVTLTYSPGSSTAATVEANCTIHDVRIRIEAL